MMELRVNEFFGPTFQGEGPFAGRLCHFLRLNRCNLHCHWCDTPYTWADTENKAKLHDSGIIYPRELNESLWTVAQALDVMHVNNVRFLVISGGEPLLQSGPLTELISGLDVDIDIQFETAGTLPPLNDWDIFDNVHYVVSPKLENSGNTLEQRHKPDVLKEFVKYGAWFKFVATGVDDLKEVRDLQDELDIPANRVFIMPEGIDAEKILRTAQELAEPVLAEGWSLTLRNHILLWGNERGH